MDRTLHVISFYELSSCAPWGGTISRSIHLEDTNIFDFTKGGCKSEDTGQFLHLQHKYSKSLSWAENLSFPYKTVNNLSNFLPRIVIWNIYVGDEKILLYFLS